MGWDTGDFTDKDAGPLHVEKRAKTIRVWSSDEMTSVLNLEPAEARKLVRALALALECFEEDDGDGTLTQDSTVQREQTENGKP